MMFTVDGAEITITDTQKKLGALHVHIGTLTRGRIAVGDVVDLRVDHGRRLATRSNHSATHLVHEALRRVLGPHVAQKGSLVNEERIRFDFAHQKGLSVDEIAKVEALVNAQIRGNGTVDTRLMTPDEAIDAGALALFGEKYGDEVRVLSMGEDDATTATHKAYSVELCGGTHVARLGDIGIFKIVSEGAVASGIRRVEALTGESARLYLTHQETLVRDAAAVLKTTAEELPGRISVLVDERRKLERELTQARKKLALIGDGDSDGGADQVEEIGGTKVLARKLDGVSPKDLRGLIDDAKQQLGSGVIAFITVTEDGKAGLAVGVTKDISDKFNAVDLVRAGSEAVGGKGGGGRPDMAQAGGPDGAKALDALAAIKESVGALAGAS